MVKKWDIQLLESMIDDVANYDQEISSEYVYRIKNLLHRLNHIHETHENLQSLKTPQVDFCEGEIDLFWNNKSKRRNVKSKMIGIYFSVDTDQDPGEDIDCLTIDGRKGYDHEGIDDNKIISLFEWYLSEI